MTDTSEYVQLCQQCGSPVDSSGFEPLSRVACPECGGTMIVSNHIAHYELLEVVGRGGMGVVYKARDTSLDRMVALKVLRKDHSQNAELVSQLETEAAVTASINHPHVVRVFTTGTDNGRFYIAMELVDKGTLDDLIGLQGQVAEAQVLEIAIQIAQGLRSAYQHGLIHRDVKPGNILFSDSHTAKIVDFGLAMLEAAAVGGGEIWGTPYYVAPEKLDQKPEDFRSDIYSFGATLFHALAGRPPFEAKDASRVALKHLKSQAVSLQAFAPHISSSTAYVINRTLLKEPDQRYQSYDELIEHFEYARTQLEHKGSQPQAKQRIVLETDEDRKIWSYVTFGMLGVAAVIGIAALVFSGSDSKDEVAAPASSTSATPSSVTAGANAGHTGQYQAARQLLQDGKPAEAATAFKKLAADNKTPGTLAQWSLLHAGLAELLANRPTESRDLFARLMSTNDNSATGATLRKIARLAADEKPVSADALAEFSRDDAGSIAPLIIGLKNWNLDEFEDAGAMLRQFQTASPRGEFAWIGDYKPLVADHLSDYSDYRGAAELLKMSSDSDRAEDMLERTRNGLRTKGALTAKFDRLAEELKEQTAKRKKEADQVAAAEREGFAKLRTQLTDLAKDWKFSEAKDALNKISFTSAKAQREHAGLARKLDDLNDWKGLVIAEINAAPGRIALAKRGGTPLPGPAVKAASDGVEIQGAGKVPWRDLAHENLIAAVLAPGKPGVTEDMLAHRRYLAGVYAAFSGDSTNAPKLLELAAAANSRYKSLLPLILPSARPGENLTKGKKATGSAFVTEGNHAPENVLDGNWKTKWASREPGPKWVRVDLGKTETISSWQAGHGSSGLDDTASNTVDFEFQVSLDGQEWKTIERVRDNRAATTSRTIPPTQARYVRLYITKASNRDDISRITEFAVHRAGSGTNANLAESFFDRGGGLITPALSGGDIGDVGQKGSLQVDGTTGEITIRVSGANIWETADSFYFAQQKLVGDGQIVARVLSVQHVDEWTKCGLMFRSSLSPGAANAFIGVTPVPRGTVQARASDGSSTTSKHTELPSKWPIWLKLVREGNKVTAFWSIDGIKWNQQNPVTTSLPKEAHVGLALASHNNGQAATAVFDLVTITPKVGAAR